MSKQQATKYFSSNTAGSVYSGVASEQPKQQNNIGLSEYTIAIDSRNRDKDKYPESNDCTLQINFSRGLPVTQIHLGSIELSLPQYTIEECWSNIYFDNGIRLQPSNDDASDDICAFSLFVIDANGVPYTASIPIWLNPIVAINNIGLNTYTLTTKWPHSVELAGFWDILDAPMQIIGLASNGALPDDGSINGAVNVTAKLSGIVINDDYNFTITTDATFSTDSSYLHAPAIANPVVLSNILNQSLENARVAAGSQTRFTVSFDSKLNKFCIEAANVLFTNLIPNTIPQILCTPNRNDCLLNIVGYACCTISFMSSGSSGYQMVCASYPMKCMSALHITPGMYIPGTALTAEIQLDYNRFYFEPPCLSEPTVPPTLVFEDQCGTCYAAILHYGHYTPYELATELQNAMNTAYGSNVFEVTFEIVDENTLNGTSGYIVGRFVFQLAASSTLVAFALRPDHIETNIASILGFTSTCYRYGATVYDNTSNIYVPVVDCTKCSSQSLLLGSDGKFLSTVIMPFVNQNTRQIGIQVCLPKPGILGTSPTYTVNVDNTLTVTFSSDLTSTAHGLQVGDIVTMTMTTNLGTVVYRAPVIAVNSPLEFVVPIPSTITSVTNIDCTMLYNQPILNLYLSEECASTRLPGSIELYHSIKPMMLGFESGSVLWYSISESLPIIGPNIYSLDHPDYLLVELAEPNESIVIQHSWKSDNNVRIFGKIVLAPEMRLERIYPIESLFQNPKLINQLKFRILNPNHTLYQMHGRDWSATLVFMVVGGSVNLGCM